MADPVAAITNAPKKAFSFAEHNIVAFLLLAVLLAVLFVAAESRKPGAVVGRVIKLPVIGKWAANQPT